MLRSKVFYFLIGITVSTSCVETFTPELYNIDTDKLVINGGVTNIEGNHFITISSSSDINNPQYNAVSNCDVKIIDIIGNEFHLSETETGTYEVFISEEYLKEGNAFKVEIITPNGDLVTSDYDTLHLSPEIDSIYYRKEAIATNDPDTYKTGYQFYIDYDGGNSNARYIKWNLIETWEYHAQYPQKWYYDGLLHEILPVDSSLFYCWNTQRVPNIFTLTTKDLVENKYKMYSLHYVDNTTQKLAFNYSLIITQETLSKEAFSYYTQLEQIINKEGGLYDKQPIAIKGNLYNSTYPEKEILGFFKATGVTKKRIFVNNVNDIDFNYSYLGAYADLSQLGLRGIPWYKYPAIIWIDRDIPLLYWLYPSCYDCTSHGGTTIKPYFMPF